MRIWVVALTLIAVLAPAAAARAATGQITTVAGTGTLGFSGDGGAAASAQLNTPIGVTADPTGGYYVVDQGNSRVRKVAVDGTITTVAGSGVQGYSGDGGPATAARLSAPSAVGVLVDGSILIADSNNNVIRKVNPAGIITTVAGTGAAGYSGDSGPATSAKLRFPSDIAVADDGSYAIADTDNHVIRIVWPYNNYIGTIAGNGTPGFSGDGGQSNAASLNKPTGVAWTWGDNRLIIADRDNHRIRERLNTGIITTIAGTGSAGFSGDGGAATAAQLNLPTRVASSGGAEFFIVDRANNRVRRVNLAGTISTLAGTGTAGAAGDGGLATAAQLNQPYGATISTDDDVLIADTLNHRIRRVDDGEASAPTVIRAPKLTGVPRPGQTLTCQGGAFSGEPVLRTYVWELAPRGTLSETDPAWQARIGQTATTYLVRDIEIGQRIRCREIATNLAGTATAPSNSLRPDADIPRLTPGGLAPQVSGVPVVGQAVSCNVGAWDSAGEFKYIWVTDPLLPQPPPTDSSTYTPSPRERGAGLQCGVVASNDIGTAPPVFSAARKIIAGPPTSRSAPTAKVAANGPKATDIVATCTPGSWGDDYGDYRYQWLRNDDAIPGATGATYSASVDDLGRLLKCQVVASNPLGSSAPATSAAKLVPLPASGDEGRMFVAVNGENWLSSTSMVAVSAQQLDVIKPVIAQRYDDAHYVARQKCKGGGPRPNFDDVYGKTLTAAQTCAVINDLTIRSTPDGVFWRPTTCSTAVSVSYPKTFRAGQKIQGLKIAPPRRDIAGFPICPKLLIDIPPVDVSRATINDPAVAMAAKSAAPKEVLWDFDGDSKVDASCGPDAPVLRTIPNRGMYPNLRAVIVNQDSEQTGLYGVANVAFDFTFSDNGQPRGSLRAAQMFACRTSMDPPAKAKQSCLNRATFGRIVIEGDNICPIASSEVPPGELDSLPPAVKALLDTDAIKDTQKALVRAARHAPFDPGAFRQKISFGPIDPDSAWGSRAANAILQASDPPKFSVPRLSASESATMRKFSFDVRALPFASDQIFVARGPVKVNGITMDPKGLEGATVFVPSDVKEALGTIKELTISSAKSGLSMLNPLGKEFPLGDPQQYVQTLKDEVTSQAQAFATRNLNSLVSDLKKNLDLGPFKLADNIDAVLNKDGTATITASAKLDVFKSLQDPSKSLTGKVVIDANRNGQVSLRTIHINAPSALLGPIELRNLDITYDGGLAVKGQILFGPGGQGIEITRFHLTNSGSFDALGLKYLAGAGQGIPIGPGVFLTQIGGEFDLPELAPGTGHIKAYAAVSAGTSVGGGCPAAGLAGDVTLQWSRDLFQVLAEGRPSIACVEVGKVNFEANTNGLFSLDGKASLAVGPLSTSGQISGRFQLAKSFKDSLFQVEVTGEGKIAGLLEGRVAGILSNKGLAGCGSVTIIKVPLISELFGKEVKVSVAGGVGIRFINGVPPVTPLQILAGLDPFVGCDLGDYHSFRSVRQVGATGRSIQVKAGEKAIALKLVGTGGVPRVKVTTPDGKVLDYTNVPDVLTALPGGSSAMADPAKGRLLVLLAQPQAGTWKIEPVAGSPGIASVQQAHALAKPAVRTAVLGRGPRRVLSYDITPLGGQSVRFVEVARGANKAIKTVVRGGKGRVPFTVSEGGSARQIVAEVTQDGLPRATLKLTKFVAPPPKVGQVRALRVVRSKALRRATVTWLKAPNADRYLVTITRAGGRRETVRPLGRSRMVTFGGVPASERITVTVRAQSPAGRRGPSLAKASGPKPVVRKKPVKRRVPAKRKPGRPRVVAGVS
jgi:hypothetical protein